MRILAIETSARSGSVAALEDETLLHELDLGQARQTAQSLAPGIRTVLDTLGWSPDSLDLVAVTQGPGSFTGLRIGVTTAKTLAYVTGAQVIGVNTLEVIARQAPLEARPLWVVLDAQRQQLFVARFAAGQHGEWTLVQATQIIDSETWLDGLEEGVAVSGPGLRQLRPRLPATAKAVEEPFWDPRAATLGCLGLDQFQAGRRDDVWRLVPQYFRKSAAEEKRERN